MKTSILTKSQKKTFTKNIKVDGRAGLIECDIRYDDQCGNGHNSFSITGSIYSSRTSKTDRYLETCGCIHDEIKRCFPELKHLIKWHLMNSDEPMYYIANTLYHANEVKKGKGSDYRESNLEFARSCAIAPDATLEQLQSKEWLEARLPQLREDFIEAVESLGFVY